MPKKSSDTRPPLPNKVDRAKISFPKGQVQHGNIQIHKRPVVKNADGSISTVRSASFDEDNDTVLLPTVVNKKVVSNQNAWANYAKTGENLGKFKNSKYADAYAQNLHKQQAKEYGG